ncbi:hypothetical protein A2U01_0026384, partial [Trifolium medium]|nr:hypothetical protein [Trifolium medium]
MCCGEVRWWTLLESLMVSKSVEIC